MSLVVPLAHDVAMGVAETFAVADHAGGSADDVFLAGEMEELHGGEELNWHRDAEDLVERLRDAPRNAEGRAAQEANWAGDYDGRKHWSLREAYRIYKDRLQKAQEDFYRVRCLIENQMRPKSRLSKLDLSILERVADFAFGQGVAVDFLRGMLNEALVQKHPTITFAARKRPLLPFEVEAGDWDAVGVTAQGRTGGQARLLCHDGRLHRTGRFLELAHKQFPLDRVYGPAVTDDEFYADAIQPLVESAIRGTSATVICYGQTGTGKTHTFNACWQRVGVDLLGHNVCVTFFEIHGKRCYDLLQQRAEVALRADANDTVHVRGAVTLDVKVTSAAELAVILEDALRLRKSEATDRNAFSSRSHAVCVLDIVGMGSLRFVDLAGSERNYETQNMTAKQHREFAEINTSLMALKECFRAHGELIQQRPARPPYRGSRLTQVLRSCFTEEDHQTLILAAVSPTATDLLHTVNSLSQVTQMSKALSRGRSECVVPLALHEFNASSPIWEWSSSEVEQWVRCVDGGRFAYLVLPPGVDGAALMSISSTGFASLFEQTLRKARTEAEGEAWNEAARAAAGSKIGKLLFNEVRKEAARWQSARDRQGAYTESVARAAEHVGLNLPSSELNCEFFFWGASAAPARIQDEFETRLPLAAH